MPYFLIWHFLFRIIMIRDLNKYLEFKFSFELPEIVLKQRSSANPKIYMGPGSVSQDENGQLLLKMYSKTSESIKNFFNDGTIPGKIIDESNYYDIIAKDMQGFNWKAERVSIGKHFGHGHKFLIINAELQQIFCEADLHEIEESSNLYLYFNKNIRLPVAPFFETDDILKKEFYKNVRIFSSLCVRNYQINVFERSNWIEVNISSKKSDLPENIDLRICEALQFITYTKLHWFFYEKFESKKNYQKLNNINFYKIIQGLTPPFNINFTTSEPNWKIFKLYLDYILDYPESNKYHPVSSLLNLIIQAEKLPIETRFQTICICVESILKSEINLEIEVDSKLKEYQAIIANFVDETIDEEYRNRIQGLLGQLLNTRPVDILYKLADNKLLDEKLIKDWEDLRHPLIHGERIQPEKLQEYLNKYYSTITLFYQLIFLKIGYTGRYTDYSVPNWPAREFNKKLVS